VDVKKRDGTTEEWAVETGTPNTLLRRGLRRQDLPAGTEIKVTGYQARDGTAKANGTNVTLPDGRALFIGSTGPDAPAKYLSRTDANSSIGVGGGRRVGRGYPAAGADPGRSDSANVMG